MKTAWDSYLDQQLTNPSIRQAYEEETKVLSIGVQLAKKIGTSTPQLSRTERRPENVNMRTLIRYAEAVGMNLDVRLVAKKHRRPLHPGLSQDRFGQLRVKAAFGPAESRRFAALTRSTQAETGR